MPSVWDSPPFSSMATPKAEGPPPTAPMMPPTASPPSDRQAIYPLMAPSWNLVPPVGMGESAATTAMSNLLGAVGQIAAAAVVAHFLRPGWEAPTAAAVAVIGASNVAPAVYERSMGRAAVAALGLGSAYYLLRR